MKNRQETPLQCSKSECKLPSRIAHRGLPPENTLKGFEKARQAGAQWIECDLRLSQDLHPVIIHDNILKRLAHVPGQVRNMSLITLKQLDMGEGAIIPTLRELLTWACQHHIGVNLEIKNYERRHTQRIAQLIQEAIERYWTQPLDQLLISSFSRRTLSSIRRKNKIIALGLLCNPFQTAVIQRASALGCLSVHIPEATATNEIIQQIRAAGLQGLVYTVNNQARAEQLLSEGVTAIFTDNSDLYRPQQSSS